jgi:DNA mismatch repair protein MutS
LAGVPSDVNERAKQVLAQLESEHLDDSGNSRISRKRHDRRGDLQLSLFATVEHPVVTRLRELDVNAITPIQALVELERLRNEALADAK